MTIYDNSLVNKLLTKIFIDYRNNEKRLISLENAIENEKNKEKKLVKTQDYLTKTKIIQEMKKEINDAIEKCSAIHILRIKTMLINNQNKLIQAIVPLPCISQNAELTPKRLSWENELEYEITKAFKNIFANYLNKPSNTFKLQERKIYLIIHNIYLKIYKEMLEKEFDIVLSFEQTKDLLAVFKEVADNLTTCNETIYMQNKEIMGLEDHLNSLWCLQYVYKLPKKTLTKIGIEHLKFYGIGTHS